MSVIISVMMSENNNQKDAHKSKDWQKRSEFEFKGFSD